MRHHGIHSPKVKSGQLGGAYWPGEVVTSQVDAEQREAAILAALVEAKVITQAQVDAFRDIHDRLGKAGLMP